MANDIILDWRIVAGSLVALLGFTCGWGYKIWYVYLKEKESKAKQDIENEVNSTVQNSNQLKQTLGVEKFANRLLNLTKLKQRVQDGKDFFEKNMIFSGVVIILAGIAYSILSSNQELLVKYQTLLFIVLGISIIVLLYSFYNLYQYKKDVEKYLNGTPIDDIFKDG